MEHRAPGNSSVSLASAKISKPHSSRNIWVVVAYAFSSIGLLSVMAYYFSDYVTH
jgi:hypothetical protein